MVDEGDVFEMVRLLGKKLPKFDDGRIDYSASNVAPAVMVYIFYRSRILLLKRSNMVRAYKRFWNVVGGYIDEVKPIRKKALEEVNEELGIGRGNIDKVEVGTPYDVKDRRINRVWRICPVMVVLRRRPKIRLNFEHTEYKWVKYGDVSKFKIVPGLKRGLDLFA